MLDDLVAEGPTGERARDERVDGLLQRYPGYTLSTLLAEDAFALMQHVAILDPDIGKAVRNGE